MRKTWRCVHDQLGWPVIDIDTFGEMIDTTGSGFRLPVADLAQHIRCVVDEYFELMRDFRLHDAAIPSLATAMAERKQGYELKAVRSAILGGQKALQPDYKTDRTPTGAAAATKRPKRKRPRERAPKPREHDSSSSTSGDDEEKPKPARGAPKPAKDG